MTERPLPTTLREALVEALVLAVTAETDEQVAEAVYFCELFIGGGKFGPTDIAECQKEAEVILDALFDPPILH